MGAGSPVCGLPTYLSAGTPATTTAVTGMSQMVLSLLASLYLVAAGATDNSFCGDISGEWSSGWPASEQGGATGAPPPPGVRWMTVRRAVTPFGKPHAQYVVDYNAALALHPDGRTCLGKGTYSAPALGFARALNSSSPNCSFIQWPAADKHNDGARLPSAPQGSGRCRHRRRPRPRQRTRRSI
jgi:hypothetical protein